MHRKRNEISGQHFYSAIQFLSHSVRGEKTVSCHTQHEEQKSFHGKLNENKNSLQTQSVHNCEFTSVQVRLNTSPRCSCCASFWFAHRPPFLHGTLESLISPELKSRYDVLRGEKEKPKIYALIVWSLVSLLTCGSGLLVSWLFLFFVAFEKKRV